MDAYSSSLDKYRDDGIFSTILRWGLYFGAFFQLACILSSVFLHTESDVAAEEDYTEESKATGGEAQPINRRLHKLRKQEKKKRR